MSTDRRYVKSYRSRKAEWERRLAGELPEQQVKMHECVPMLQETVSRILDAAWNGAQFKSASHAASAHHDSLAAREAPKYAKNFSESARVARASAGDFAACVARRILRATGGKVKADERSRPEEA